MKRSQLLRRIFCVAVILAEVSLLSHIAVAQEGKLTKMRDPEIREDLIPNDPLFEKQKPLFDKLKILEAWQLTIGSSGV